MELSDREIVFLRYIFRIFEVLMPYSEARSRSSDIGSMSPA